MPDRRAFLKDVAAGIAFVGCGLAEAASAAQAARPAKRPPLVIKGRRIRTVDIHAHCLVPKATDLLKRPVNRQAAHPLEGQPLAAKWGTWTPRASTWPS